MTSQKRRSREAKERLAELYVGVRDGYVAAQIAVGSVKARGKVVPDYLRDESKPKGLTGIELENAVDRFLAGMAA